MPKSRTNSLTTKQAQFLREYLVDLNATQAAKRAGYSPKTCHVIGHELLKKPEIQEALANYTKKQCEKAEISADFVLDGLRELAVNCKQPGECFNPSASAKSFELLGKYLKLFTDKIEHSGNITVVLDSPTGRTPGEN